MKIAYFDCIAGISGDMTLGALVNAGVPLEYLENTLKKLNISEFSLTSEKVLKKGIESTKVHVGVPHEHVHRHLSDIEKIIHCGELPEDVKSSSLKVFRNLAEAEASIHGTSIDKIHFHEVGAMDSIIDIIGSCAGLHYLSIEKVYVSKIHVGSGFVKCAHGTFPLPAPATSELLKGLQIYSTGIENELTTPTGAALMKTFAEATSTMPEMTVQSIGYGAGSRELDIPNIIRLIIGETSDHMLKHEKAEMIEANIDDMNPEFYDHIITRLLSTGAMDVTLTPIHMKKNRPAVTLSVLISPEHRQSAIDIIFSETTTIGLRVYQVDKYMADRTQITCSTPYGDIRVKVSSVRGKCVNALPEYEDCRQQANVHQVPVKTVYESAINAIDKTKTDLPENKEQGG